jgi:hypothetical protein
MSQAVITLTSDLGNSDHYVAALKGGLLCKTGNFHWVDVSNTVSPFDVSAGAWILNQAYRFFPQGSLHLLLVGNGEQIGNTLPVKEVPASVRVLIAKYRQHFFLSFDNGALSRIFDEPPSLIHAVELETGAFGNTFIILNQLPHILHTMLESSFTEIPGKPTDTYVQRGFVTGFSDQDSIRGLIVHTDHFGNAITDVHREQFLSVGRGRSFQILYKNKTFDRIDSSFSEHRDGDETAIFNSMGFLELCIKNGSAYDLLGARKNESLLIRFSQ